MGVHQSKDELLYRQVDQGNVECIKALRRAGAGLEWIDKEGKTPLILACTRPELLLVVKVLIDLGANVNEYRPGSHAGTPLHHAVKKGLVQTVELLLAHGANPLAMNDDCKTALDLARTDNHWNIVRLIESRICLFAGWLQEVQGPSILEAIVRQWVSRKIWAVILPCGFRNPVNDPNYELAIYSHLQAAIPYPVIPLWKVQFEEPLFNQPDPALVIVDKATKKQYMFLSENTGDKQQLYLLYNACRGIPQHSIMPNASQVNLHASAPSACAPHAVSEDMEPAMAINTSIQWAIAEGVPLHEASNFNGWGSSSEDATRNGRGPSDGATSSKVSTSAQLNVPAAYPYNGLSGPEATRHEVRSSGPPSWPRGNQSDSPMVSLPSAPPMVEEIFFGGPVRYPSIDSGPVDLTVLAWEVKSGTDVAEEGSSISCPVDLTKPDFDIKPGTSEVQESSSISCPIDLTEPDLDIKPETSEVKESSNISGTCVICLDAQVEGACFPCGHMVGCMPCLKEIKSNKWVCSVCHANIDQIVKLYAV